MSDAHRVVRAAAVAIAAVRKIVRSASKPGTAIASRAMPFAYGGAGSAVQGLSSNGMAHHDLDSDA
jgi:hypothetical protein